MSISASGSSLYMPRYYARVRLISTAVSGDYDTALRYISETSTTFRAWRGG
jgi:hypothetical protein